MSGASSSRSLRERAMLEHVLKGQSVIDWKNLHFSEPSQTIHFMKVNEFDLSQSKDLQRLSWVHNEACGYLKRELDIQLAPSILNPSSITDLFFAASNRKNKLLQKQACSVLKTMNIINHIDGRELLYNCSISLRDLFSLVEDKVELSLSQLKQKNTLVSYEGGRKPKESLITKLLGKKETIAAQIYDRVRYRIITKNKDDIEHVILHLFDTILPYNYVIPGVSTNQLLALDRKDKISLFLDHLRKSWLSPAEHREFTGRSYRVCKFVADIPLRLDRFLATAGTHFPHDGLGSIVYVLVEFQIVDEKTHLLNNRGDNRHEKYKRRQKKGVARRLGMT